MRNDNSSSPEKDIEMLRRTCRDSLPRNIIVSALVIGIVFASTTLYLSSLERAASIALH